MEKLKELIAIELEKKSQGKEVDMDVIYDIIEFKEDKKLSELHNN